jgi:hypothetical protein
MPQQTLPRISHPASPPPEAKPGLFFNPRKSLKLKILENSSAAQGHRQVGPLVAYSIRFECGRCLLDHAAQDADIQTYLGYRAAIKPSDKRHGSNILSDDSDEGGRRMPTAGSSISRT